jgi:hypothetical protein
MDSAQESPEIALIAGVGRRWLVRAVLPLVLIILPGASWSALVINEFLPDPEGSDGGREFVELLNTGPGTQSLERVSLQFPNGAEGAVWATRWTGTQESPLAPGQRFLIVDRNWLGDPAGQAEVYLGLQNGPDAVRLVRRETVLDLVGYVPLTDPAMKEGDPADIAPGLSLSRRPDGRDSGDNYTDFALAEPTPGAPNFLPFSLNVIAWELDPPTVDRMSIPVRFTLEILNNGTEIFPVGAILLRVGGVDHGSLLDQLPAGQQRRISWFVQPPHLGLLSLDIMVPLPSGPDTLVLHPASLQVGPGNLILNEVLAVPRRGQGEWVEIAVVGDQAVDLVGHSLRDEDGSWRPLPELRLEPGNFLVLAQDSFALAAWHLDNQAHGAVTDCRPELAIANQRNLPGWPTLNNTPTGERDFADRVYLADPAGHVIDHLTIGGDGSLVGGESEPGLSLERLAPIPRNPGASNWAPCTAGTGSTPGCPNSVARGGAIPMEFTIQPRILDPAAGASSVHFLFTLSGEQVGWELRVFDLWGGLVRDLGGENLGAGPRDLPWDGRDDQGRRAGPGGYVVLLEVRDRFLHCLAREKVLMVIR